MTTKRSTEGPCSLANTLYHPRSLELCKFKKFYVGKKRVCTTILFTSPNQMSQEFTTLPLDNHESTVKMTQQWLCVIASFSV